MSYLESLNNLKAYRPKAKLLKILGNERRLAIIDFLARHEEEKIGWTVTDIARELKIPYKAASQHLQLMEAKGLLDRHRMGKVVAYMASTAAKKYLRMVNEEA